MSRRRYISTDISLDSKIRDLAKNAGDFAVVFYTWMIPHSEDDGIVKGNPEELLARIFPMWRWIEPEQIERSLQAMHDLKLVLWDKDNNEVAFPAKPFYKYQTYIKQDNRRTTAENTEEHRGTPRNTEEHQETPNNTVSPSPSLSPSLSPSKQEVVEGNDSGFAEVIKFYQDNIGLIKDFTQQEICHFLDDGMDPDLIIEIMKASLTKDSPWSYTRKVLQNCFSVNVKTMVQYEAKKVEHEKEHEKELEKKKSGHSRDRPPKPVNAENFEGRKHDDSYYDGFFDNGKELKK